VDRCSQLTSEVGLLILYTVVSQSPQQGTFNLGRHTVDRNRGGRPVGPNPATLHRSRKDFPSTYPCLVTWRVVDGFESLRREDVALAIEDAFRLAVYSIQRDHLHLIVEADDRDALGRGMMALAAASGTR
jgi:hypothetical protein